MFIGRLALGGGSWRDAETRPAGEWLYQLNMGYEIAWAMFSAMRLTTGTHTELPAIL